MTINEIKARFPNASDAFIKANLSTGGARPDANVEPSAGDPPLHTEEVEVKTRPRFFVRVTSVRSRLCDEDNLCEKYHVDLCRYSGILAGDGPYQTKIRSYQRRPTAGEPEHTIIEIFEGDTTLE